MSKPQPPVRGWRPADHRPSSRAARESSRRTRLACAAAAFVGIVAAIAWFLLHVTPPPRTHLVLIGLEEYRHPAIPPNVAAHGDADRLTHGFDPEHVVADRWDDRLDAPVLLADLPRRLAPSGGSRRNHLVVHCAMHGLVVDGEPVLLGWSADPARFRGGDVVRCEELLRTLEKLPFDRVLLVLDASRPEASWSLGRFGNDFAPSFERVVDALVAASELRRVSVLVSASADESGWIDAHLPEGATVFGHFVGLALRGAADAAANSGNADELVGLQELHRYVAQNVADHARRRFGVRQTVRLLGAQEDFDVVYARSGAKKIPPEKAKSEPPKDAAPEVAAKDPPVSGTAAPAPNESKTTDKAADAKSPAADPSPETPEAREKRLAALWELVERLHRHLDDPAVPVDPAETLARRERLLGATTTLTIGQVDHAALRLADLGKAWHVTAAGDAAADGTTTAAKQPPVGTQSPAAAQTSAATPPPAATPVPPADAETTELRRVSLGLDAYFGPSPILPDDLVQRLETSGAEVDGSFVRPLGATAGVRIGRWLLLRAGTDAGTGRESLKTLGAIVEKLRPAVDEWPAEIVTLGRCAQRAQSGTAWTDAEAAACRRLLEARSLVESTIVADDAVFGAVHDELRSALVAMVAAERWFLSDAVPDDRLPRVDRWLAEVRRRIAEVERRQRTLESLRRQQARAAIEIPVVARWLADRMEAQGRPPLSSSSNGTGAGTESDAARDPLAAALQELDGPGRRLIELIRGVRRIDELLARAAQAGPSDSSSFDEPAKLDEDLRRTSESLTKSVRGELEDFLDGSGMTARRFHEWAALRTLSTGLGGFARDASDRRRLWEKWAAGCERSDVAEAQPGQGLWQGYWAIRSIELLGAEPETRDGLARSWEALATAVRKDPASDETRAARVRLGGGIRDAFAALRGSSETRDRVRSVRPVPANGRRHPAAWLALRAEVWRWRARTEGHPSYERAARRADPQGAVAPSDRLPAARLASAGSLVESGRSLRLALEPGTTASNGGCALLVLPTDHAGFEARAGSAEAGREQPVPLGDGGTDLTLSLRTQAPPTTVVVALLASGLGPGQEDFPLEFAAVRIELRHDPTRWRVEFFADADFREPYFTQPTTSGDGRGVRLYVDPAPKKPVPLHAVVRGPVSPVPLSLDVALRKWDADLGRWQEVRKFAGITYPAGPHKGVLLAVPPAQAPAPAGAKPAPSGASADPNVANEADDSTDVMQGLCFYIAIASTPPTPPIRFLVQPLQYPATSQIAVRNVREARGDSPLEIDVEIRDGEAETNPETGRPWAGRPVEVDVSLEPKRAGLSTVTLTSSKRAATISVKPSERDAEEETEFRLVANGLPTDFAWRLRRDRSLAVVPPVEYGIAARIEAPPEGRDAFLSGKDRPGEVPVTVVARELENRFGQWRYGPRDGDGGPVDWWPGTGTPLRWFALAGLLPVGARTPLPLERIPLQSSLVRRVGLSMPAGSSWSLRSSARPPSFSLAEELSALKGVFDLRVELVLDRGTGSDEVLASRSSRFAVDDAQPPKVGLRTADPGRLRARDVPLEFDAVVEEDVSGIRAVTVAVDTDGDGKLGDGDRRLKIDSRTWSVPAPPLTVPPVLSFRLEPGDFPPSAKDPKDPQVVLLATAVNGVGVALAEPTLLRIRLVPPPPEEKPVDPNTPGRLVVTVAGNVSRPKVVLLKEGRPIEAERPGPVATFEDLPPGRYTARATGGIGGVQTDEAPVTIAPGKTTTANLAPRVR